MTAITGVVTKTAARPSKKAGLGLLELLLFDAMIAYATIGAATVAIVSSTGNVRASVHSGGEPRGLRIVKNEHPATATNATTALITPYRTATTNAKARRVAGSRW